jgi:three-Cys-motif partner protein
MAEEVPPLFDLSDFPIQEKEVQFKRIEAPVWTENKAQLIARYLRYFVFITKHGTYLDAFAGAQQCDHPTSWAARLVLESEPKWFRAFALFELEKAKWPSLESLCAEHHSEEHKRSVRFFPGDMNVEMTKFLSENPIRAQEATFCLLDQHTFECDWQTVVSLATHKREGHKIELFYFLAQGWFGRAVAALNDRDIKLAKWWGSDGWKELLQTEPHIRGQILAKRFQNELGYAYSYPFPIYEHDEKGGRVMFWMVHASDHPEAPKLMWRAYRNAVAALEPKEQLEWEFGGNGDGQSVWKPAK